MIEFAAFSAGIFMGAVFALRYIAPMIYHPTLSALRNHIAVLESENTPDADPVRGGQ